MVMCQVAQAVYDDQVTKIVSAYSRRRDAMLVALRQHMPDGVSWTKPRGGMFVWMTLPAHLDGAELLAAALHEERVAFVPGGAFFVDGRGTNTIRLNYSLQSEAGIGEGARRLGRLIVRFAAKKPGVSTPSAPRAA